MGRYAKYLPAGSGGIIVQNPDAPLETEQKGLGVSRTRQEIVGADIKNTVDAATQAAQIAKAKAEAQSAAIKAEQDKINANAVNGVIAGDPSKTGSAYLATLPEGQGSRLQAMYEGRLAVPLRLNNPQDRAMINELTHAFPDFDATRYNERLAAIKNGAVGNLGSSGNAIGTTIAHLGVLAGQTKDVAGNEGIPGLPITGMAENWVSNALHNGSPGLTTYRDTVQKVAAEEAKAYGTGTGGERGQLGASLSENLPESAKMAAITNAIKLLAGKQAQNLQQYKFGSGGKPSLDLLDPAVLATIKKYAPEALDQFTPNHDPMWLAVHGGTQNGGAPGDGSSGGPPPPSPDGLTGETTDDNLLNRDIHPDDPGGPLSHQTPWQASLAGQGMSGVNEGIADTLGLPVDAMTAAMNLVPEGINAVANTHIPSITEPFMGGDWWRQKMGGWGIYAPNPDGSGQFARRVGQSIGAASVPIAGAEGTARQSIAGLLAATGGGLAAATAQQVAPNSPTAQILAELAGTSITGAGLLKAGQRAAQGEIEATIPTTQDLRDQAGQLYRQAETNGVAAGPAQTTQLANDFRQTLKDEGQLGPNGSISNADTSTSKALNLVQQYEGLPMRPTEMNTVRTVIADGRSSSDPADRRVAKLLLGQFDDWARPMAPQFDDARAVASRYLTADDLEKARELAGARAGQFTGSGFENALRTEYRKLDRANINDQNFFPDDVLSAVHDVSRGTPLSNAARNIGRLAPTGPVSGGLSIGVPFGIGSTVGGPGTGTALAAISAGLGTMGRIAATRMGTRNAEVAELLARNGGPIDQAPLVSPDVQRMIAATLAGQPGEYLDEQQAQAR